MAYESKEQGNAYRQAYVLGVEKLIARRRAMADSHRAGGAAELLADPEQGRARVREVLGWPLVGEEKILPNLRLTAAGDTQWGAKVYRAQFEVFPEVWYYGILFLHDEELCRPMIISQHGGLGTPELCSGMHGTSSNYNGMTRRAFETDANVFAPQHLLWDPAVYPVTGSHTVESTDLLRRGLDQQLKQVGGSIAALELWCLFRAMDKLQTLPYVQGERFGMVGLSYGGFYTMYAAALDPRIVSAVSCSFFNDRYRYGWSDFVFLDAARTFMDGELALLTYPRRITYQIGQQDELFDVESGKREFERAVTLARSVGVDISDCITLEVFPGGHELSKDNSAILRMGRDLLAR